MLIRIYNNKIHDTTKFRPAKLLKPEDIVEIYANQKRRFKNEKIEAVKFKVGDLVRVVLKKKLFSKTGQQTFGDEIFRVAKIIYSLPRPTYVIKELNMNPKTIKGRFYANEILKVNAPKNLDSEVTKYDIFNNEIHFKNGKKFKIRELIKDVFSNTTDFIESLMKKHR